MNISDAELIKEKVFKTIRQEDSGIFEGAIEKTMAITLLEFFSDTYNLQNFLDGHVPNNRELKIIAQELNCHGVEVSFETKKEYKKRMKKEKKRRAA